MLSLSRLLTTRPRLTRIVIRASVRRLRDSEKDRRQHAKHRVSELERNSSKFKFEETEPDSKSNDPFGDIEPKSVLPGSVEVYGSIGEEISGKRINKALMLNKLHEFFQIPSIRQLAKSHYIDDKLFTKVYISFRRFCYKSTSLPPELHVTMCDVLDGHGHVSDLFPAFLSHAREAYPHLECFKELRKISNLGQPHLWYPEAREKSRKIIFHAGPTNSGKTHGAMKRFLEAKSGVYCGPLKLLAHEVRNKSMSSNIPCDLITGEMQELATPEGSSHKACTVEMTSITDPVEVAVIDEIQMLKDDGRGWAWTRALLGIPADEVHLCGEEAAIDLVRKILLPTTDTFEMIRYNRLTRLEIEEKPLADLKEVRKGDCIVCFSKDSLYKTCVDLKKLGLNPAVVYGTLPPGTKSDQCKRFNELKDYQVMVATDAIGMGLNLSIGRIIFSSMTKKMVHRGKVTREPLSTSQCLQIAGRAGRYKTCHETGYVTTYHPSDLSLLKRIMSERVPPLEKAGLYPTADQMELFAYHLPHLGLSTLLSLFVDICEFDSSAYFICDTGDFKKIAEAIDHIKMPLRSKYLFCCSPINTKSPFVLAMLVKYARQFSEGEPIPASWFESLGYYPYQNPKNLSELSQLEELYDVFDLYLWLSYRFPLIFSEPDSVRELQSELDPMISRGVSRITELISAGPRRGSATD